MGRVIKLESASKERTQLVRHLLLSAQQMISKTEIDEEARDIAAYLVFTLMSITNNIEATIEPWEKRGYWLKADRFRIEWMWTSRFSDEVRLAIMSKDWLKVTLLSEKIVAKLVNVKVPVRFRLDHPWEGSYQRLLTQSR